MAFFFICIQAIFGPFLSPKHEYITFVACAPSLLYSSSLQIHFLIPCAPQQTFLETVIIITTYCGCHPTITSITQAREVCTVKVNKESEVKSKVNWWGCRMTAKQTCGPLFQFKDVQGEQRILFKRCCFAAVLRTKQENVFATTAAYKLSFFI